MIPLPVYEYDNIFTSVKVNVEWIAVDLDRYTYIIFTDADKNNNVFD